MIIYLIKNKVTGKQYIGKTSKSVKGRWTEHIQAANRGVKTYLYDSIRKHGPENFFISEIDKASTEERLNEFERYYIKLFDTYNETKGYNLTLGGDGVIPNEKTLLKMKSVTRTKEQKEKIRQSILKLWNSDIYRKNHSDAMAKVALSETYQKNQIEANKKRRGKKLDKPRKEISSEGLKNISCGQKKRFSDPEQRKLLAIAQKKGWEKKKLREIYGS